MLNNKNHQKPKIPMLKIPKERFSDFGGPSVERSQTTAGLAVVAVSGASNIEAYGVLEETKD